MNREKIVRIIKEEISKKLKESRAAQLRREIDDAVNGTDYGYTPKEAGEDPTIARGRGLEVDGRPEETKPGEAKPSCVGRWPNGNKRYERYVVDYNFQPTDDIENFEMLHRANGPAITTWDENGQKTSETWAFKGVEHRTDGPSNTTWYSDGQKRSERFEVKGNYHRIGAPAVTMWDPDGWKASEHFYENGKRHNTSGPASIVWGRHGEKPSEFFYLDGVYFDKKDWEQQVAKLNRPWLDLDGESEGMKPSDNKELEARSRGLDLDDTKNRPEKEDRFKQSIAGQKLTEKKVRLNKTKTRLVLV